MRIRTWMVCFGCCFPCVDWLFLLVSSVVAGSQRVGLVVCFCCDCSVVAGFQCVGLFLFSVCSVVAGFLCVWLVLLLARWRDMPEGQLDI